MIRNVYTNKQLSKVQKYNKFLILRTYNALVIIALYVFISFNAIKIVADSPFMGLLYLLGLSFVIYYIVVLHNRAFYGLYTPIKNYQEHIMVVLGNNKSKHGLMSMINTIFLTALVFFVVTTNIYVVIGFAAITLLLHMVLVDTNDLGKIGRAAKKLDMDVEDYRLFDNGIFENLTAEQVFYVYSKREELVAFIALDKQLTAEKLQAKIDKEEYALVTMMTRQMEKLGK